MSTYSKNSLTRGFTIVEVLIIAPIVILMIGIFISAIVSMTGEVLSSRGSNDMAYDIQNALDKIQQDVKLSGGFLSTNNIILSAPQGYNDDTTNFDNANANASIGDALILNSYATTNNPLGADRSIMYMSGQPNACNSAQLSQNQPVMINTIYFVKDGTLWRRTVMPSNYETIGCVGGSIGAPWQLPSSSPSVTNKTQDERLVDGIQDGGFSVNYYNSPDSTSPNTTTDDPAQSDSVRQSAMQTTATVGVTISATGKISGRDISQSASIRATSQNNNVDASVDAYWSSFGLQNNWVDYNTTYNTNGYRRTKDGIVILRGLIRRSTGTIVSGEILGTLPLSYRPSEQLIFQTGTYPDVGSRIDIHTDGTVRVVAGNPGWLSLEGIKFLAPNAPVSFTNLSYANSWTSYGLPFSPAAYAIDADGRVHTKGLVRAGTVTDGTVISTLPAGAYPSEYHHIATHNSGAFGMIGIFTNGILAKGGGNGYLSLQAIFYPASYTGWTSMVMQNSWVLYAAGFSTPQYTKASDGLVTIHGLVKAGTVGSTIATLPVGYRPSARAIFSTASNSAVARLDIDSSGNIIAVSGTNIWFSMDGISFYADQ
ncbi:MAG: hypothetical protein WA087_03650 [Candidatus Saccharimonadales bacterium]